MNLNLKTFWSRVKPDESGCWLWTGGKNNHGYGHMKAGGKTVTAHRIMYQIALGQIPDGLLVMHKCDNPACVNPNHLITGTNGENLADAARKNRMVHKLTLQQVREVRRLYMEGFTQMKLAEMFNITQSNVSRIVCLKRRYHVYG